VIARARGRPVSRWGAHPGPPDPRSQPDARVETAGEARLCSPARPSPQSRWDAVVIGAGFGGVTAAAVLASAGCKTLVIDKNARAGGKAIALGRAGTRHELWPIAGGPALGSRFHELAEMIGLDPESWLLTPEQACEFVYLASDGRRASFVMPARPLPALEGMRLLAVLGASPARLGGLLAMSALAHVARLDLASLDRVSALAVVRRLALPGPVVSWIAALLNVLFVVPVDRLPASEALRTLQSLGRGGAGRYHAGGFGSLAERAVEHVAAHGGAFLPKTRVLGVRVEAGRVRGVETGRGFFEAPLVISNAGIQPTILRLVGAEHFDAAYVERVRGLLPSWALVGSRLELDAPVVEHPMTIAFSDDNWMDSARFAAADKGVWPADPLLFATVPSLWDPTLSPVPLRGSRQVARGQVVLLGTLGSPDPSSPMNREAIDRVVAAALRLWPTLERHVVRRRDYSARHVSAVSRDAVLPGRGGECIGIGQLIGQCGRSKPSPRTPVGGLWLTGCDAGGWGCGTHQAVDSGFEVARQVLERARGDGDGCDG
jgi:prolycopene isomerase